MRRVQCMPQTHVGPLGCRAPAATALGQTHKCAVLHHPPQPTRRTEAGGGGLERLVEPLCYLWVKQTELSNTRLLAACETAGLGCNQASCGCG